MGTSFRYTTSPFRADADFSHNFGNYNSGQILHPELMPQEGKGCWDLLFAALRFPMELGTYLRRNSIRLPCLSPKP